MSVCTEAFRTRAHPAHREHIDRSPLRAGARVDRLLLQELRESCPDELQSDIFDQGRTQTTWYRIEEFQRVSLKIIAEAPQAAATAEPASPPHPALMP